MLLDPKSLRTWLYVVRKVDWGRSVVPGGDWRLHKRTISGRNAAAQTDGAKGWPIVTPRFRPIQEGRPPMEKSKYVSGNGSARSV